MSFRKYAEYKESGVEGLGEVPKHWAVRQLKYICRFAYGDSLPSEMRIEGNVPVYGSNGHVGLHSFSNTTAPCIIIGRKGSFGKVNYSSDSAFAIDTTFFVDSRYTTANIRWLYYLLGLLQLDAVSKDSIVPGLNREDAYQQIGLYPPLEEQKQIAAFLDKETTNIDTLIDKQEQLITLLQEKRQAIISHAVTRGLNTNVKMKDSGVEWLGEVPEHWEVRRLKFCVQLTDQKIDANREKPLPYVGLENIQSWTGKLLPIDPNVVPTSVANRFGKGMTLFGKLRPYLAKACNPDFEGLCSTELLVFKSTSFDRRLLLYLLLTDGFIKVVDS